MQPDSNPHVIHPNELLKTEKRALLRLNDWAAFKLAGIYGAALTIWLFAAYSLVGALVHPATRDAMLFWSNAAQLIFCPLMVYVGNKIQKGSNRKADTDHAALTHIANQLDRLVLATMTDEPGDTAAVADALSNLTEVESR